MSRKSSTNISRKRREAAMAYYRLHPWAPRDICYYCGSLPDTLDHVPPINWVIAMGALALQEAGAPFLKVPACKQCNSILGSKRYFTCAQRKAYIASALREKYRALRSITEWSEEELEQLDGNLETFVRAHADWRLVIERRIAFAEAG
jgi:hypothetical protein